LFSKQKRAQHLGLDITNTISLTQNRHVCTSPKRCETRFIFFYLSQYFSEVKSETSNGALLAGIEPDNLTAQRPPHYSSPNWCEVAHFYDIPNLFLSEKWLVKSEKYPLSIFD
jgi:hypothetical protein